MQRKNRGLSWILAAGLAGLIAGCAGRSRSAENPEEKAPETETEKRDGPQEADLLSGLQREVLPNGLVVLIKEDHRLPIVATAVGYKVGSVYESEEHTGLAHYLEHMMFKGTDKYKRGDIDLVTLKAGGANNAFTSNDMTVYWFQFSSDRLDDFLEIESNRMTKCTMDPVEFEHEKKVVEEELNRTLDSPWGPLQEDMEKYVFPQSGYRHPVLGWREQLDKMTRESMADFYKKYYQPNNAVLVIVGDVDSQKCMAKVTRYFGPLPKAESFPPARGQEPPQERESRFEVPNDGTTARLMMAWRGGIVGSKADISLDVISTILTTGRKSRLHKRLVEKDHLAADGGVSSGNDARKFDGMFTVDVELKPTAKVEDAEKAVLEELALIQEQPVTDEELQRAKNILRANFAFGKETTLDMTTAIVQYEVLGLPNYLRDYMARVKALTAKDLQEMAKTVFDGKRRNVGIARPKKDGKRGFHQGAPRKSAYARAATPGVAQTGGAQAGPDLGEFWQVRLDNGLTILLKRKGGVPVVAVHSYVRAGPIYEPEDKAGLANMVGNLLDQGTWNPQTRQRRTHEDIAGTIENIGGSLSTGASGVSVKVLSEHREIAYDLVRDLLLYAEMADDRLEHVRQNILNDIETSKDHPESVARKLFYETVYKGHPLHRPSEGYKETVEKLTRAEALAHYRRFFRPDNTIISVVGDIDPPRALQELRSRFEEWKAEGPLDLPKLSAITRQIEPRTAYEFRDKLQVNVYLGHVGVDRLNPDYPVLEVLQNILCTGSGFTDRLSVAVRDKEGLAYTVGGTITSGAGEAPAPFIVYLGTEAPQKDRALRIILGEIKKFIDEGPTDAEVDQVKQYLTRNFVFRWETNDGLAAYLIELRRFNLPPDDVRRFIAAVKAVTKQDVQRAAQKYLDMKNYSLVIVGPVDKDGNVVKTRDEKEKEKEK